MASMYNSPKIRPAIENGLLRFRFSMNQVNTRDERSPPVEWWRNIKTRQGLCYLVIATNS